MLLDHSALGQIHFFIHLEIKPKLSSLKGCRGEGGGKQGVEKNFKMEVTGVIIFHEKCRLSYASTRVQLKVAKKNLYILVTLVMIFYAKILKNFTYIK